MFITAPNGITKFAVSSSTPISFVHFRFSGIVATLEHVANTNAIASYIVFKNLNGFTRPIIPTMIPACTTIT